MTNNIDLINSVEEKREEVKEQFGLSDEEFNILIRNVILDSFDKLKIRLSADDPIFAVIFAQKNVMDYYSIMITNSLNNIPKQIGNAIDSRLNELSENIQLVGEAFDNELTEFKKEFSTQTLELNNQIIAGFNSFIDKKVTEIKNTLESTNQQTKPLFQKEKEKQSKFINIILLVLILLNLTITGIVFYSTTQNKGYIEKEKSYLTGLFKAFEQVKKELPEKEANKVQSIVIDAIDKELKSKK
ncbi:hypothetical protein [Gilliamella sp. BG6]|uniref:hypothetical protein n=1 Tax=unclassified Gilliamella TaxID=2685620 RepID=UPI0039866AD7